MTRLPKEGECLWIWNDDFQRASIFFIREANEFDTAFAEFTFWSRELIYRETRARSYWWMDSTYSMSNAIPFDKTPTELNLIFGIIFNQR
jgi:hypothetical protein